MRKSTKTTKKDFNKDNILNQGVAMLMKQGYHGTGLQKVLDAVNIPKGSFYNYFEDKEHFGAEVIQYYIDPFLKQLAAHLNNSDTDALGAIQRYFDELIEELERNNFKGGCLLGNLMGEIGDTSDICQASLQTAVNRYRDLLQSGLKKAQDQGAVRKDKTAGSMADLLINTWQGALLRAKIEKTSAPVLQCCQELLGNYFKS
ncbi:TetR/AcrR family transcriptional regulator [Nitrosomonas marina]|uniref:Transcriptional regulator, TetR family n=1 Tax=Nitrosomonas marina TaxID=917 RepID=A0A1H8EYP3_9PROT|nr:TetR/AcrR family transcriptional regulator [Nitrosomonas marina]SEN24585.1 transcriptional regulator, TetR family [Nitrosomonas marina]